MIADTIRMKMKKDGTLRYTRSTRTWHHRRQLLAFCSGENWRSMRWCCHGLRSGLVCGQVGRACCLRWIQVLSSLSTPSVVIRISVRGGALGLYLFISVDLTLTECCVELLVESLGLFSGVCNKSTLHLQGGGLQMLPLFDV